MPYRRNLLELKTLQTHHCDMITRDLSALKLLAALHFFPLTLLKYRNFKPKFGRRASKGCIRGEQQPIREQSLGLLVVPVFLLKCTMCFIKRWFCLYQGGTERTAGEEKERLSCPG